MAHAASPSREHPVSDRRTVRAYLATVVAMLALAFAFSRAAGDRRLVLGTVPFEFVPFGLTLLGVALLHRRALEVAVAGVAAVVAYKLAFVPSFRLGAHLAHEASTVSNLLGLLLGFALLADHFERSGVPARVPALLPGGVRGAFVLLALVFVLSSFLDNIAAAMIGGVVAKSAFACRVSVGYVAAIVAASNAGGAGSVLGDTTTTMMWIEGIPPSCVVAAFLPATVALLVAGSVAAVRQTRLQPLVASAGGDAVPVDAARLVIVALILACAIAANVLIGLPAVGVWAALLATATWRAPGWMQFPSAAKGALFLVALVLCASMMPVDSLPRPSTGSTFGIGFVSSVFDNIPLTKLALAQDGYDWALLAFAVGYGGSMVWFGSSAGVAISKEFPQARNLRLYLKEGWIVAVAYVVGFAAYVVLWGWHPSSCNPK